MNPDPLSNLSSLKALEWESVRSLLVKRAARLANRIGFAGLDPGGLDRAQVDRSLAEVEVFRILLEDGPLRLAAIPEVVELCDALSVEGGYLDGVDLLSLARFAGAVAELASDFRARLERRSLFGSAFLQPARDAGRAADLKFVQSVGRCIGPKGEVRDDASPELRRLRARTNRLKEDLDLVFDTYLRKPNADDVLQDKVVASRNGRSVLMVKAEARRSFDGVVHGASRAHKTTFIEPIEAVAVNNELVVVSEEEQEETRQILRRLSEEARDDLPVLLRCEQIVQTWDALNARARLARDLEARVPSFSEDGSLTLICAIHPLLMDSVRRDVGLSPSGREPVPLDLQMTRERRILVIGGPNTGGKTVALKTVGLLCLMARSGLPVPAGPGTTLPFFDSVFAEIGDDQSLGAGLSTFSAQIAGIAKMKLEAKGAALILLDELGSGTDPLEGGALGAAVIDDFAQRGAMVIATTHNADLKLFAQESPIGRCASFSYDPASFAPTFTLVPNQPGRSLAFEIASRLGVPSSVVDRARARLPESARRQEAILADLAREKAELEEQKQRLAAAQNRADDLEGELSRKLARIDSEREGMHEKARSEMMRLRENEDARLRALFAEAQQQLKEAKTERAVARVRTSILNAVTPRMDAPKGATTPAELGPGDFVEAPSLGWRGRVTAISDEDVEIDSGGKRIRLARSLLQKAGAPKNPRPRSGPAAVDVEHRTEVMLLGMRVDEAIPHVDKFLDDAFRADVPCIRVVHGFGQGRLRSAVRDLLKSHPHVTSFRDGAPGEGGGGVTIVELRT